MRHSIRECQQSLLTNLKHLHDYLTQVKKENALREQYEQINLRADFITFKEMFMRNRWINFTPSKVDEFFNHSFERINDSFNGTLDNTIQVLEARINSIKNLTKVA